MAVVGSQRVIAQIPKIIRRADGWLAGAAGRTPRCEAFKAWFLGGAEPTVRPSVPAGSREDDLDALVLSPDGKLFRLDHEYNLYRCACPFSIGESVAASMAFAAMALGKTPAEAVALAIEHTIYVGGPVQIESLAAQPSEGMQ